ncbi:hypothetical protein XAP6164_110003 [Xanthomonas phaseoli pv. phaseoli]|nr:hypothetical protein XAP6164_110003 [Xanthomonas phaseoli pv. phaseoli]
MPYPPLTTWLYNLKNLLNLIQKSYKDSWRIKLNHYFSGTLVRSSQKKTDEFFFRTCSDLNNIICMGIIALALQFH